MTPVPATAMAPLLEDFSLEMTGKDVARLEEARDAIPPGHPDQRDLPPTRGPAKAAALAERRLPGSIITQFGFDVDPVLSWIEAVRDRGIDLPIRIGVPGPAGVRRLMSYAARFGVSTSAGIARKYGLSLANLMGTAGPDRFIRALAQGYDARRHGEVKLHFYAFGGLQATTEWITDNRGGYGGSPSRGSRASREG